MKRILLISVICTLPLFAAAQRQRTTTWESGMVQKGDKVGVWEYFSYTPTGKRVVTQRYDHTTNVLVFSRPDDKLYYAEVSPGRWNHTLLTQPPWFIGGHEALSAYTSKLEYPSVAQDRNVQGRVVVSFVVDTLGHTTDHQVMLGIGSGCDEEALRVSRTVPQTWLPGRIGSRAVPVRYELPFTFRLN